MTMFDVQRELGMPDDRGLTDLGNHIGTGNSAEDNRLHMTLEYKAAGTPLPLFVQFHDFADGVSNSYDSPIYRWCIFVPKKPSELGDQTSQSKGTSYVAAKTVCHELKLEFEH
jgi:hypothetical protein